MTDRVQKIREFLVGIAEADGVNTILAKTIEKKILPYIVQTCLFLPGCLTLIVHA